MARLKRELFRDRLVNLLIKSHGEELDIDNNSLLTDNELDVLRYYFYILHGIDKIYVAPMDTSLIEKVRKPALDSQVSTRSH